MATVQVELGERSYSIFIEQALLPKVGALIRQHLPKAARALVITDDRVGPRYAATLLQGLEQAGVVSRVATFPAGESSKSLAVAGQLYSECVEAGLERSSVIVALGGGVVGDLAGFVAATYLRGLPFVQVPTTLLAQVDSSVGGKTGVDLPAGKNLVGAFHQPTLVAADLDVLRTLPQREVNAGMAEVVKHAIIRDPALLSYLEDEVEAVTRLDPVVMERVVARNCEIKAAVVGADERESGLRAILNFGHTIGHAVEALLGYSGWLHGECVAVGMMGALALSQEAGVLRDRALCVRLEHLLVRLGLPFRLPPSVGLADLAPLMQRDKKVESGRIRWVLVREAGDVVVTPDISPESLEQALRRIAG